MRRFYLILVFQFFGLALFAQSTLLNDFNQDRLQLQRRSMIVLGSWAVGNIAVGAIGASQTNGATRQFHLMNAGWNIINLGLAGLGYYQAVKTDPSTLDLYASIDAQHTIQKILLFNAGLDLGYMAGGLYLLERSKNANKNQDQLRGFGRSIILQGAFLFVFDLSVYALHASNNSKIRDLLGKVSFSTDQIGIHWIF